MIGSENQNSYSSSLPEVTQNPDRSTSTDEVRFSRDIRDIDFTGISFSPWNTEAAAATLEKQSAKAYTVMIYMNGSDLESMGGAATKDILEMLGSGLDADNANLILFTGGTNRWQNNIIPSNQCALWRVQDGKVIPISGVGLVNMGDPGTLSSFINFSMRNFPAEKYGLIFWDHGGGSIAGYGHDEKFQNSRLTLLDMNYAFEMSDAARKPLEFLGFDACLMATVEVAVMAAPYARYLIASEDLEPGDGWDYRFLSALNTPRLDGAAIGKKIADSYMSFYGNNLEQPLTLSVTDLSRADLVMDAMGKLMSLCSYNLEVNRYPSFNSFSERRNRTKTFGNGSPRDNGCDMVDVGDMAAKLSDLFPGEAERVQSTLRDAVVYNRNSPGVNAHGLTTYYIFGGKDSASRSLNTYAALNMSAAYTGYLRGFAEILTGGSRINTRFAADSGLPQNATGSGLGESLTVWTPSAEGQDYYAMVGIRDSQETRYDELWPSIDGQPVCMYEIDRATDRVLYAVPAVLNGKDADLIVLKSAENPNGKILGARKEEGYVIQKGYDIIQSGDQIMFYYRTKYFGNDIVPQPDEWQTGPQYTVQEEPKLTWNKLDNSGEYYYSQLFIDTQRNEHFTALTETPANAA